MTKQPNDSTPNGRDRPVKQLGCSGDGLLTKGGERLLNPFLQLFESGHNALPLEGLSFWEDYISGALHIAVVLQRDTLGKSDEVCILLVTRERDVLEADPAATWAAKGDVLRVEDKRLREQIRVLIGDVQIMQGKEVLTLSASIGLDIVEDTVEDSLAGAVAGYYVSFNGALFVLDALRDRKMRLRGHKGEERSMVRSVAISFDQNAVGVIEGCPQIVEGVPQHSRSMTGQGEADRGRLVTVWLGPKSLFAVPHIRPEDGFKLRDVMVGPFDL
ncbi:MAG: hypothetical protein AB7G25_08385 [Sphingomonadaceae bacterium]